MDVPPSAALREAADVDVFPKELSDCKNSRLHDSCGPESSYKQGLLSLPFWVCAVGQGLMYGSRAQLQRLASVFLLESCSENLARDAGGAEVFAGLGSFYLAGTLGSVLIFGTWFAKAKSGKERARVHLG